MKKITKDAINIEEASFIVILILLIGLPLLKLTSYNLQISEKINDSFQLNHVWLLWLSIPFLFYFYLEGVVTKKIKINYIDIFIYFLIITAIISTVFAIDKYISIFGERRRQEGLLSILAYYLMFLNAKNIKSIEYKRILIKVFIAAGLVQVLYGILQVYTNFGFIKRYSQMPYMASGLSGNPNFLGSYMVMNTLIMITLYLLNDKKIYLFLASIFFIGICIASSTGPFLGFILAVLFLSIYYRKKIKLKNMIITLLLFIAIYEIVNISLMFVQENIFGNLIDDSYNIKKDLLLARRQLTNGDLGKIGSGRIEIWKNSIPLAKKYWTVGAGLDNFGIVYGVHDGIYYDKAHNVYLQLLITNGLDSLIAYLSLCAIICFKGLKIKENTDISLYIAFIGYSIQAFANISVIDVAPMFFIIFGMLAQLINESK